jgi:hypothetical protein
MNTPKNPGKAAENQQEKHDFWLKAIATNPPRVRFSHEIRTGLPENQRSFDHVVFMMFSLENHPLIPFAKYTFGSDLLDFRRGVAYEVVLRLLAHVRSFVANVNIRNRPGAGPRYGACSTSMRSSPTSRPKIISFASSGR